MKFEQQDDDHLESLVRAERLKIEATSPAQVRFDAVLLIVCLLSVFFVCVLVCRLVLG